ATGRQHDLLQQFLKQMQVNVSSQVLIEAKIVEVTLDNEFQSGIDWTKLGGNKIGFVADLPTPATTAISHQGNFNFGTPHQLAFTNNIDLTAAVQLVENFGTTRTLSSPRLHATNNQQAILTFTQNDVFFSLQVTPATTTTTGGVT